MNDYPTAGEILESNSAVVLEWKNKQFRSFKSGRKMISSVFREASEFASRLVEDAFPAEPQLGPPIHEEEDSNWTYSVIAGAVTVVALILLGAVGLGPLALLGIPAVLFWIFMTKAMKTPKDMPFRRAEQRLESKRYSWNKSRKTVEMSLAESLQGRFVMTIAEEFGVPGRLWPAFAEAVESWQTMPFAEVKPRIQKWADQPKYPDAPGAVEEGVSHEQYEAYCCSVMHHWGYMDAKTTRYSVDGGVDIESKDFVVQCKHVVGTVGAPDVQKIFGIATARGKKALIFSAGSFSKAALKFADEAGVGAVLISEINGTVRPQNAAAKEVIVKNQAGPA